MAKTAQAVPLELTLHRWAGYILAVFYPIHVTATRFVPVLYDLTITTGFIAVPLVHTPFYFYYWYYGALAVAGFYHLWYGLPRALRGSGVRVLGVWRPGTTFFKYVSIAGCLVIASSILALGGAYFPIQLSQVERYHEVTRDVYGRLFRLVGMEWKW